MMKVGRFEPSLEEDREKRMKGLPQQLIMKKYIWSKMMRRMN